ncbi:hypothetical protein [Sphingopyxis sp. JAI108]|uniref:hypothetical protein n=1 Tax=Sphingopyxis sp. JAI108 TaxID=2723060 RepID=UPI0015CAAB42|nr:hypothetical protein [Sphingopyxis sp. JAI108]NYF30651.1 hypothetical protein [Sphingopyxis sp. JAI108]
MGGWIKEGQPRATHIFEAAAWLRAIKPVCRCGHSATFNPYGIWWRFQCRMWDDDLTRARQRFWCVRCGARTGKRVRPVRIELVDPRPDDIALPMCHRKPGGPRRKTRPFCLSYTAYPCHAVPMTRDPKWKRRAIVLEFWLLSALVAGSFVAGIIGAIRSLAGS